MPKEIMSIYAQNEKKQKVKKPRRSTLDPLLTLQNLAHQTHQQLTDHKTGFGGGEYSSGVDSPPSRPGENFDDNFEIDPHNPLYKFNVSLMDWLNCKTPFAKFERNIFIDTSSGRKSLRLSIWVSPKF